ncbi:MAG: hypothetical protein AB1298_07130 [Bacteroidota bacterium]
MKKILIVLFFAAFNLFAQEFTVEKVSGEVQAMIGTSEEWIKVKVGQKLSGSDLIATNEKAFIQLASQGNKFILQSNSALGLSAIKKITLNELLLALAMEEIRNVPKTNGGQSTRNTAVYGKEVAANKVNITPMRDLGFKKLNGAKQLAQSGYKESAIIVAKETFRKYPETKSKFEDRLYFVDLMLQLNLNNEAAAELNPMRSMQLNVNQINEIDSRLKKINEKEISR